MRFTEGHETYRSETLSTFLASCLMAGFCEAYVNASSRRNHHALTFFSQQNFALNLTRISQRWCKKPGRLTLRIVLACFRPLRSESMDRILRDTSSGIWATQNFVEEITCLLNDSRLVSAIVSSIKKDFNVWTAYTAHSPSILSPQSIES